jgi:excisionase family DNA binding protein
MSGIDYRLISEKEFWSALIFSRDRQKENLMARRMVPTITSATLTEEEAAQFLGVGVDLVRRLRREGELPHVRLGERVLFYPPALEDYLRRKSEESVHHSNGMSRIPR